MFKKPLKYAISLIALMVIAYHSVYFKKLDEVKAASSDEQFDAASYAHKFWNNQLIPGLNKAIEISKLLALLKTETEKAFNEYSNALGIGNIRFFLIEGQGEIIAIRENDVSVLVKGDTSQHVIKIATEYIFGNAVRDASGLISINEFDNTMDFNNVSAEINEIIRTEVLPPFKASVKKGSVVQFTGAIELNKEHVNLEDMEVIPVQLKILEKNQNTL